VTACPTPGSCKTTWIRPIERRSGDADSDDLSNVREYQLKTNPRLADTDGDQSNDGAEIQAGTDPLRADSKPPSGATLYVGSGDLAFTWQQGQPHPTEALFYVRGAGGRGKISWSGSLRSAGYWLRQQWYGPTQTRIGVAPEGMASENIMGRSPLLQEATGSPYEVRVTLKITSATSTTSDYHTVEYFRRCI